MQWYIIYGQINKKFPLSLFPSIFYVLGHTKRLFTLAFYFSYPYLANTNKRSRYTMKNEEIKTTIKVLNNRKEDLSNQISALESTIKSLEDSIERSRSTRFLNTMPRNQDNSVIEQTPIINQNDEYDETWSLNKKALFMISKMKRFLHNREIANLIHEREPDSNANKLSKQLSPRLSRMKKDGKLTNIKAGSSNRNTFWGSPKWLDENGKIQEEYTYDKNAIIDEIDDSLNFFD